MEQLRMLFRKKLVVPVFAVSNSVIPLFEEVASHFSGGQVVTITRNSDNLLDALQKAYSVSIQSVCFLFSHLIMHNLHSFFTMSYPLSLSLSLSHSSVFVSLSPSLLALVINSNDA